MAVFVPVFPTHFPSVSFKPSTMSARPARKIVPTAKLTTENAGELLLTSHRNAVASAIASLAVPPPPTTLRPSPVSNLATPTPPTTTSQSSPISVSSGLSTPIEIVNADDNLSWDGASDDDSNDAAADGNVTDI